jgi:hypothetical protein
MKILDSFSEGSGQGSFDFLPSLTAAEKGLPLIFHPPTIDHIALDLLPSPSNLTDAVLAWRENVVNPSRSHTPDASGEDYCDREDGSQHEENEVSPQEELGLGGCLAGESDDLKRKFEGQFARMKWGCDHHGTGSKPCSCDSDFCRCVRRFCAFLWC